MRTEHTYQAAAAEMRIGKADESYLSTCPRLARMTSIASTSSYRCMYAARLRPATKVAAAKPREAWNAVDVQATSST
jgi:hypothetical protein